ncbi:MAG: type II toxin-antitoxin system ParD family antitoxin [Alphaproteobacteria bacterium]
MTAKLSISVTDAHAKLIDDAVESGEYASASEVVRAALRRWRSDAAIGRLWDEGLASGRASPQLTMTQIKAEAKRRSRR